MAIKDLDKLTEIIGAEAYSSRTVSFVWISVAQKDQYFTSIKSISASSRDLIADYLKQYQNTTQEIRHSLQTSQIPEHCLNWVIDSHRQSHWIEKNLASHISSNRYTLNQTTLLPTPVPPLNIPHNLLGRNRSIAIFDYWASTAPSTMRDKINFCQSLQLAWHNYTRTDRFFAWLEDGDTERKREFFWGWLKSKNHHFGHEQAPLQNHEDLLIFFDRTTFNESDKELFSTKAKKAWDQQERRNNSKDKKQCNFILSENTISKLKMLAHKHGLTRTAIIELVIESEAKNEHHISERMHRMSALTNPLE